MLNRMLLSAALWAPFFIVSSSFAESHVVRSGDLDVDLSLDPDPPRTGENQLLVTLTDSSGRPVDGASLAFVWDMPAMGSMPEMKGGGEVAATGRGRYTVGFPLSMDGDWTLTLSVDAPGHPHRELKMKAATGRPGLVVEHAGADASDTIDVSLERRQLIGVTFDTVRPRPLAVVVRAPSLVKGGGRARAAGRLWLEAAVFERDAGLVSVGQRATVRVPALVEPIEARVTSVAPVVDDKTGTLAVRLDPVRTPRALKLGMSGDVSIEAVLGTRLAVPDSALLTSGEHRYAFVDRGGGRLRAVEVEVGVRAGDEDEVRGGLSAGDRVATTATFLLSSEAKLRDALPRWRTP